MAWGRFSGLLSLAASLGLLCRAAKAETDVSAADAAATLQAAPSVDQPVTGDDIIVTAPRYGEARVKAETEFSEEEISTFGADSVRDLLGRMGPFIDAGEDEPVILVNGKPTGFNRSVLDYPPEALDRLAVLPPEAAARYGHSSGKRVVNLVLKHAFASLNADADFSWATRGGQHGTKLSAGQVTIDGSTHWNVQAFIARDSALRKSARTVPPRAGPVDRVGYIAAAGGGEIDPALSRAAGQFVTAAAIPPQALLGAPTLADFAATANQLNTADPNDYETLAPSRRSMSFSAGASRPLGAFSASLSVNASRITSHDRRGLAMASIFIPAGSPWSPFARDIILTRPLGGERALRNDNLSKQFGVSLTLSGPVGGWQTSFSTNYTRNWSDSLVEHGVDTRRIQDLVNAGDRAFNPYGLWEDHLLTSNRSRSRGDRLDARVNAMKSILTLPAGPVAASISLNASRNHSITRQTDTLTGQASRDTTTYEQVDGQMSVSLPLSRRVEGEKNPLGDLTLDVSMSGQTMSGSPLQKRFGSNVIWSPVPALQLRGTLEHAETAPMIEQLDGPVISIINRVYDYSRQEMAEPLWSIGGNPGLERGSRQSFSVNATVRPFNDHKLSLNIGYRHHVAKNGVAGFPVLTPAIEAAFPERVTRNAEGRLIAVDARPINIAHDTNAEIISGISLRWQAGHTVKSNEGQKAKPANPVMVMASLNHHWRLKNELLIRPGIPPIDQLGRDGGQPRHQLTLQATVGQQGLGATLIANWTGTARLSSGGASGDFHIKPSTMYNLSMHIEPEHVFHALAGQGWAKDLRVSVDVQNLFDSYRRVTFSDGSIPTGYSRDEVDPLGRTVRISVRKKF